MLSNFKDSKTNSPKLQTALVIILHKRRQCSIVMNENPDPMVYAGFAACSCGWSSTWMFVSGDTTSCSSSAQQWRRRSWQLHSSAKHRQVPQTQHPHPVHAHADFQDEGKSHLFVFLHELDLMLKLCCIIAAQRVHVFSFFKETG